MLDELVTTNENTCWQDVNMGLSMAGRWRLHHSWIGVYRGSLTRWDLIRKGR